MQTRRLVLCAAVLVGGIFFLGSENAAPLRMDPTDEGPESTESPPSAPLAFVAPERDARLAVATTPVRASACEEENDDIFFGCDAHPQGGEVGILPSGSESADALLTAPYPLVTIQRWLLSPLSLEDGDTSVAYFPDPGGSAAQYDLSEACGLWGDGESPLRGSVREWDVRGTWCLRLMAAIETEAAAFAAERPRARLGVGGKASRLFVWGSERAVESVERVLDARATSGGPAIVVDVERIPSGAQAPTAIVRLEVPWNRRVRALSGAAYGYLKGVDIEIAQSPTPPLGADPVFDSVEAGFAASAVRVPDAWGTEGVVEVDVVDAADPPVLTRRRSDDEYAGCGRATVEVPQPSPAAVRIAVAARPGVVALTEASDGSRLRIRVLGEVGDPTAPRRGWRRATKDDGASRPDRTLDVQVRAIGRGWETVSVLPCPDRDGRSGPPGPETAEHLESERWTARVESGDDGDVDLVLRAPTLLRQREVAVEGESLRPSTWRLPCMRLCVLPLRLTPGRSDAAIRRFQIDRGGGPETFEVLVRRLR